MGIHRTLSEAQSVSSMASWKQRVIIPVTLKNGVTFFRTYLFNAYEHKCKRCRKAYRQTKARGKDGSRERVPCTGQTCPQCGNPFGCFARRGRKTTQYVEGGKLH